MTGLSGKTGTGSGTKKESSFSGKSGFPKTESNVLSKSSTPGKSYTPSSLSSSRSGKTSTSFGIIWIPTKKRIKKDYVYNSHYFKQKERSPSMYQLMESPNKDFFKEKSESELCEEGSKADGLTIPGGDVAATAGASISLDTISNIHYNQDNALQPQFHSMTLSDLAKFDPEDNDSPSNNKLHMKIDKTKEDNKLQPQFDAMTVSDLAKIDPEETDSPSNKKILEKIDETKKDNKLQPQFCAMTLSDLEKFDPEDIDSPSNKKLLGKIDETNEDNDEAYDKKDKMDYLENKNKMIDGHEKDYTKSDDNIDGTLLDQKNIKKPPPDAVQPEENDWLVNCMYYGLVCCDCVIM